MLAKASERLKSLPLELRTKLSFEQGYVRTFKSERHFDAIISLFHVACYQTKNEDIIAYLKTARSHLLPGGCFIFDFWYGPAVLKQTPDCRIKRLSDEKISVTRLAEPVAHTERNVIDVNYEILVEPAGSNVCERFKEQHVVRYFFLPEMEHFLELTGFKMLHAEEWMSGRKPETDTWGVCVFAQAR